MWWYALVQQVVDDLEPHGGFTHAARSGHGDDGRDAELQALPDLADEMPAGGGTGGAGSSSHQGLDRCRVSTSSGGRGRGVWGGRSVFTMNLFSPFGR